MSTVAQKKRFAACPSNFEKDYVIVTWDVYQLNRHSLGDKEIYFSPLDKKDCLSGCGFNLCREKLHYHLRGNRIAIFAHRNMFYRAAKFILMIERRLKVKEFSKFYHTKIEDKFIIEISPFWIKRGKAITSLFTILLRAGYIGVNKEHLVKNSRFAIGLFLSGKTRFRWWKSLLIQLTTGWHDGLWNNSMMPYDPYKSTKEDVAKALLR